jgi:hypothetical protein
LSENIKRNKRNIQLIDSTLTQQWKCVPVAINRLALISHKRLIETIPGAAYQQQQEAAFYFFIYFILLGTEPILFLPIHSSAESK